MRRSSGSQRGPARHGPAHEHAVDLEPEVVVQPRRAVALDHEAPASRRRAGRVGAIAGRLWRLREVALAVVRLERHPRQPSVRPLLPTERTSHVPCDGRSVASVRSPHQANLPRAVRRPERRVRPLLRPSEPPMCRATAGASRPSAPPTKRTSQVPCDGRRVARARSSHQANLPGAVRRPEGRAGPLLPPSEPPMCRATAGGSRGPAPPTKRTSHVPCDGRRVARARSSHQANLPCAVRRPEGRAGPLLPPSEPPRCRPTAGAQRLRCVRPRA